MPGKSHHPRGDGAARVLVDSSAWLAFLSARDSQHGRADATFRELLGGEAQLYTTVLVVAETHGLLLHRAGIAAARAFLAQLHRSQRLTLVYPAETHHARARAWIERLDDQKITYTDAVSFAVMESLRLDTALTFDGDFAISGFHVLPALRG